MKLFKKMLLSALALVCTVTAFASCGGQNNDDNNGDNGNNGSDIVTTIEKDLSEIAENVMNNSGIELRLMAMDNTDEYFYLEGATGLTDETLVKEVIVYESAFGSQAISFVFVRVSEGTNAVDVAKEMYAKIDRRKWVCVGADTDAVAASADLVCFGMADSGYEIDLNKVIENFKSECGGKLDYQNQK